MSCSHPGLDHALRIPQVIKTCETKRSLLHTILGFLAPPKPSDKSRWLNLDSYLDWAEKVLCFGKVNMECIEREKYDSKLAWLHDFKPYLKECGRCLTCSMQPKHQ